MLRTIYLQVFTKDLVGALPLSLSSVTNVYGD